jgi:hypothetical protein
MGRLSTLREDDPMTNSATPDTPAVQTPPLFYSQPDVLRFPQHGKLGIKREGHYKFAAEAVAIPLTVAEFAAAGRAMPIVFAQGDEALPLAVSGLSAGRNLFIDSEGAWRPGLYIPAYISGVIPSLPCRPVTDLRCSASTQPARWWCRRPMARRRNACSTRPALRPPAPRRPWR